jgi:hypothetical protein
MPCCMIRERRLYFHSRRKSCYGFLSPLTGVELANPFTVLKMKHRGRQTGDTSPLYVHFMHFVPRTHTDKICLRMKCQNDYEKCLVIARFYLSESTQMLEQCSVCVVGVSVIYPTADIRYRSSIIRSWVV